MVVAQTNGLNRQARKFLLENCISKRGAEVIAFGFSGYLNGQEVEDITLIRETSKWSVLSTREKIVSINGEMDSFSLTKNSL
jgi:hypothetical protein